MPAGGEEQSNPAGRSLVKRRQESVFLQRKSLSRLAASPLDFALTATPLSLMLQRESGASTKRLSSQDGHVTL